MRSSSTGGSSTCWTTATGGGRRAGYGVEPDHAVVLAVPRFAARTPPTTPATISSGSPSDRTFWRAPPSRTCWRCRAGLTPTFRRTPQATRRGPGPRPRWRRPGRCGALPSAGSGPPTAGPTQRTCTTTWSSASTAGSPTTIAPVRPPLNWRSCPSTGSRTAVPGRRVRAAARDRAAPSVRHGGLLRTRHRPGGVRSHGRPPGHRRARPPDRRTDRRPAAAQRRTGTRPRAVRGLGQG